MAHIVFTDRELDVMSVLWDAGGATVADVRRALPTALAYTTVLTVLRTLESKGHVRHEGAGRAHRYYPLVDRASARRSAVRRLMDRLFAGSAVALVAECVTDRNLTEQEIGRLRRLLDERREREGES